MVEYHMKYTRCFFLREHTIYSDYQQLDISAFCMRLHSRGVIHYDLKCDNIMVATSRPGSFSARDKYNFILLKYPSTLHVL